MENSGPNPEPSRRYGFHFSHPGFLQAPITALLEHAGILRLPRPSSDGDASPSEDLSPSSSSSSDGEVSIRIIPVGDQQQQRERSGGGASDRVPLVSDRAGGGVDEDIAVGERVSAAAASSAEREGNGNGNTANNDDNSNNNRNSYQRYDIQLVAKWIEQILPFSLLLFAVFIRQHLQGFFVTIWVAAVMLKSNDILKKQTALKGERKISVLLATILLFTLHVGGVYWWYRNDSLLHPLIMLPPKAIPPFWHAVFIIMVNGTDSNFPSYTLPEKKSSACSRL